MQARLRIFLTLLGTTLLLGTGAATAQADTSDFSYDSFDADFSLSRAADGTSHLEVTETLVARFPESDQNRGIIRAIPQYYQRVGLETEVQSIVDENGAPVPYTETDAGDFLELALGTDDFVHGPTTYVITYTQDNVVGYFPDTDDDEFYWDAPGTGFGQPFERADISVTVDPSLVPALTGDDSCYRGPTNSKQRCDLLTSADAATGAALFSASTSDSQSTAGLAANETLTVVIPFQPGTFTQGVATQDVPREFTGGSTWWSVLLGGLGVGAAALLSALAVLFRVRRKDPGRGIVVPQYSVPEGLNVMVAAHLVDQPSRAVPAQLVSLAVRGNLRILDYPVTDSGAEYTLQFLTADGADPLEVDLLKALFDQVLTPGEVRELAPNDEKLGKAVNAVSTRAGAQLKTLGYIAKRGLASNLLPVFAVLLILGGIAVQVATLFAFSLSPWPLIAIGAGVVALVLSLVFAQWKAPLTAKGADQRDYLLGMQVYLELAEQERFRMLQSPDGAERIDIGDTKQVIKLYEKLLPFAVIWGVEDEWSKELEVKFLDEREQPDWYTSQSGFSAMRFTSTLGGLSHSATYVPAPASSSWTSGSGGGSSFGSSFGGSGGGGFSGGGGGGGGGGGR